MKYLWCMLALSLLLPASAPAGEAIPEDVALWVSRVLDRTRVPTGADYNELYPHLEDDIDLAIMVCAAGNDPKCMDRTDAPLLDRVPSFYLAWLRTKLPLSPRVEVVGTRHLRAQGIVDGDTYVNTYDELTVHLNDVVVTFRRETTPALLSIGFPLWPVAIDGRKVADMFEAEKADWARRIIKNHGVPPGPAAPAPRPPDPTTGAGKR